jgi:RimJ/RimL family protein N-acetyltransferase
MHGRCRFVVIALVLVSIAAARAGEPPEASAMGDAERGRVVERVATMVSEGYVSADVGAACAGAVRDRLAAGAFDGVADPEAFALKLTEILQAVSRDEHLRVSVQSPPPPPPRLEDHARARAQERERRRGENFGFERVERLDGNVGYLDLRYFTGDPEARPLAIAAMRLLASADAIVVDMRRNAGGNPEMIRLLCSYFFDRPVLLVTIEWRNGRVDEYRTRPDRSGPRLAETPIFIVCAAETFSAAEGFCYLLQARGRATIVGERTRGGANPGRVEPAGERFGVFIPAGRVVEPVTGGNWEGVGVEPDVVTDASDALETALTLAREAAAARRRQRTARLDARLAALTEGRAEALRLAAEGRDEAAAGSMIAALGAARDHGLLQAPEVTALGRELTGTGRTKLGFIVLGFAVEAFPDHADAANALADAHERRGERDDALRLYRRVLEIDPGNEHAKRKAERLGG